MINPTQASQRGRCMPDDDLLLFSEQHLLCKKCRQKVPLPYGRLPRTTLAQLFDGGFEDQIVWPPDEWKAVFACPACGRVDSYDASDIRELTGHYGDAAGYHDEATMFVARFPCANRHCKLPAIVYANVETGGASEYLRMLKLPFFQGMLACGHDMGSVPESFYSIDRVTECLW
jgi:predicted RNA-binding Zn-ribbon protein involved in translation (DUF1610 family)